MARVTIEVERVLEIANGYLACTGLTPEAKQGVYQLLARVLHETDNYAGYVHNNWRPDHGPKIAREDDTGRLRAERNPDWTLADEVARTYLYSRRLKKRADKKQDA